MKHTMPVIYILLLFMLSCKTNKAIPASGHVDKDKADQEVIGHLKMGFIGYEIADTNIVNKEVAEMYIEMMGPAMESELVFNHIRSADIVKEDTGYVRRILYDRSENAGYHFLTRDSIDYFFKMSYDELMKDYQGSDEENEEVEKKFQELIKVKKYPDSKTEILGFKCDEITTMHPDDFTKVFSITYMTNEIPFLSEAMGPLSKFYTGAPLKTIMYIEGLTLTMGAVEYNEDASFKKYLDFNPENYQELTFEQYEEMK